jgi:hypothetical protein
MAVPVSMPVAIEQDVADLVRLGITSEDARVLTNADSNVLIVGEPERREDLLQAMASFLQPQSSLILRDLETLDGNAQRELLQWLDGAGRHTRVVSLTSPHLYSLVTTGRFLDTLYYRLNTVRLEPV